MKGYHVDHPARCHTEMRFICLSQRSDLTKKSFSFSSRCRPNKATLSPRRLELFSFYGFLRSSLSLQTFTILCEAYQKAKMNILQFWRSLNLQAAPECRLWALTLRWFSLTSPWQSSHCFGRIWAQRPGFDYRQRRELLFVTTPRPAPGPTQPITRLIMERLPQRVQKAAPGCYHSPPRKSIYVAQIIMMYQTTTLKLNNKPPYKHRVQEYVELYLH